MVFRKQSFSIFVFCLAVAVHASSLANASNCASELVQLGKKGLGEKTRADIDLRVSRLSEDSLVQEDGSLLPIRPAFERLFADQILLGFRASATALADELGKVWRKAVRSEIELRIAQAKKVGSQYYPSRFGDQVIPDTGLTLAFPQEAQAVQAAFEASRRKPIVDLLFKAFGLKSQKSIEGLYRAFHRKAGEENALSQRISQVGEDLRLDFIREENVPDVLREVVSKRTFAFGEELSKILDQDFGDLVPESLASIKAQVKWPNSKELQSLNEQLFKLSQDKKVLAQSFKPERVGDRDFDTRLTDLLVDNRARELKAQLIDITLELKQIAGDSFKRGEDGNWTEIEKKLQQLFQTFDQDLSRIFKLEHLSDRDPGAAVIAKLSAEPFRAKFEDGRWRIQMQQVGVAEYWPEIASVVLRSSKERRDLKGPALVLGHGEGTDQSHVGSWQTVIKRLEGNGFYPVALSLPMSGPFPTIALEAKGLVSSIGYYEHSGEFLKENWGGDPLGYVGRSAGSTKGLLHVVGADLLWNTESPFDFYILQSFSNPRTLDSQLANIDHQIAQGIFSEKVPEALDNFERIVEEGQVVLDRIKQDSPHRLLEYGYNVFLLQGNADEDGGPRVMEDLREYRDQYMPLAPILEFQSPFIDREKYPFVFDAAGSRDFKNGLPLEYEEGTHFLDTERTNVSMHHWHQMFPSHPIAPEDLPARADQHDQVAAARYAAMDYLERYCPMIDRLPSAKKKSEELRAFRIKQIGDQVGEDGTWVEWFRKNGLGKPISDQEYEAAPALQRGGSLASRIKYVENQLKFEEPARIEQLLAR